MSSTAARNSTSTSTTCRALQHNAAAVLHVSTAKLQDSAGHAGESHAAKAADALPGMQPAVQAGGYVAGEHAGMQQLSMVAAVLG